jgi:predicted nucleic acid-binding Zn ribbon protein
MVDSTTTIEALSQYCLRTQDFAKLIKFTESCFKIQSAAFNNREGTAWTSGDVTVGPVTFRAIRPKFEKQVVITAKIKDGHSCIDATTGVDFLINEYLLPPIEMVPLVDLEEACNTFKTEERRRKNDEIAEASSQYTKLANQCKDALIKEKKQLASQTASVCDSFAAKERRLSRIAFKMNMLWFGIGVLTTVIIVSSLVHFFQSQVVHFVAFPIHPDNGA